MGYHLLAPQTEEVHTCTHLSMYTIEDSDETNDTVTTVTLLKELGWECLYVCMLYVRGPKQGTDTPDGNATYTFLRKSEILTLIP